MQFYSLKKEDTFWLFFIDGKRFQKELSKLKPVDIGQLNEKSQRLRTLFLVLAGDKRVINELSLEGMADLFHETPEILSLYESCAEDYFDASKLVDYKNNQRRAL